MNTNLLHYISLILSDKILHPCEMGEGSMFPLLTSLYIPYMDSHVSMKVCYHQQRMEGIEFGQ
jgi:hypothetical protein